MKASPFRHAAHQSQSKATNGGGHLMLQQAFLPHETNPRVLQFQLTARKSPEEAPERNLVARCDRYGLISEHNSTNSGAMRSAQTPFLLKAVSCEVI